MIRNFDHGIDGSMTRTMRLSLPLMTGFMLVLVATLLIGADPTVDPNFERLKSLPPGERQRLWENLQRFDKLSPADQGMVRELDRKIAQIENPTEKADYLSVLRRYHLWFESLPEAKRQEILNASSDERMNLVSKFMADQKTLVDGSSPRMLLKLLDLGSFTPIEVAMIYKVWRTMPPEIKARLEKAEPKAFRNQIAKKEARAELDPSRFLPSGYKETEWLDKIEKGQRFFRVDQIVKREVVREEMKRHHALNLYFLRHPAKAVADANLVLFLSQLPETVRSTFDVFSPEEARRRLSISYRMVFPNSEITAATKPGQVTAGPAKPTSPPTSPDSNPSAPKIQTKSEAAKPALPL